MGKLLKIASGLVLLIVGAVIVAPKVIDPNDYREQIQTIVKEKIVYKEKKVSKAKLNMYDDYWSKNIMSFKKL